MSVEIHEKKIITDLPYEVEVFENRWLTLSDGTQLSYRLWLPKTENKAPTPVILEYIPYRKRDGTRGRDEPMHGFFSGHGYACIRVDMRGTGESDGLMHDEYLQQEQDDALEVIDWISKQPWCDGNVGMMGKSWGGFNSLQVAALQPPALKAIICVGFTDDRYNHDIHYKGGNLLNDNFWWGSIMAAYQSRPIDPEIAGDKWHDLWMDRLENMPFLISNWTKHQTRDEYWKHGSVCEDYSAIKVPVFAIDGWADCYRNTPFTLMNGLDVPRKAIIGPWAHVYAHDGDPLPAMSFLEEAVKWWDKWLKGIDNDTLDCPMIQAWMEDYMVPDSQMPVSEGRWVGVNSWPTTDTQDQTYFLTRGKMTDVQNEKKEIELLKTPLNHGILGGEFMGAGVHGETPSDQRIEDGMAMVFDSEKLDEAIEVLGAPVFKVRLSSDKEDAMLYAALEDVAPDGAVRRVSYGVMNLTHLHGHDKVVKLVPGEEVDVTVTLDCCAHRFEAGHRFRLALATSYWPMFWVKPEDVTLSLDLSTAEFAIPKFVGNDCVGPNMKPVSAAYTPCTVLSEGRVDRSVTYDIVNDAWTCITDGVGGVFGEGIYRFDDIGTIIEHNLKRELTLSNKDPLSAKYVITQKMKLGREGWLADADIITEQTADHDYFYITCDMKVKEGDQLIFDRKWESKIERNGN